MLPASDGFSEAVTLGHTYARELYVCEADGTPLALLPMDPASSLQVGTGLVRRTGTLIIDNADGTYAPGGLIDFGRSYLLRYVVIGASGVLTCDQPLLYADFEEEALVARKVTLPVSDGMRIVSADAQLSTPVSFADGTALESVVRTALEACGGPTADASYDLDAAGAHLVGLHGYEPGTAWSDILNGLLTDYALDLWAAPPCVYTLRPIPDPTTATPVATWRLGAQVHLLDLSVRRQSLARNHAIVSGLDQFGVPFSVEVFDENPDSPVRWGTAGVGDLAVRYQSDAINTPEQALLVARTKLVTGEQLTYTATVPVDPSLDRRDVVRIVTDSSDGLAMLEGFPLPVAPGSQQVTVQQARALA